MALGKVVRKVEDRGFGFIRGIDGIDYFFHMSAVPREPGWGFDKIQVGDEVDFDIQEVSGRNKEGRELGPRAVGVTRA